MTRSLEITRLCRNVLFYLPSSDPVIHRIRTAHVPGSIPLYRTSAVCISRTFFLFYLLPLVAFPAHPVLAGWFSRSKGGLSRLIPSL
ncbi:hypothetical protein [Bacteroides sp. 14(A)]|uniref:hypothetical protein n=1 Tax=Bacteroides sp. 14(A) TaxID=1163670 RepID=UPI0018CBFC43|nr:hypothetical protein [Bacteroides sp. 14(A)]